MRIFHIRPSRPSFMCHWVMLAIIIAAATVMVTDIAWSKPDPYFKSLRADEVNVRQGPGRDHKIIWVFRRAGVPVEVTAAHEHWRRVRDSEGTEGWVYFRLLSGRRTALTIPWQKQPAAAELYKQRGGPDLLAKLGPNVVAHLHECDGRWCRISVGEVDGWMHQDKLWGVYKNEVIK